MSIALESGPQAATWTEDEIVSGIETALRRSVDGYIEAGRWLNRGYQALGYASHPDKAAWKQWLAERLGISDSYASRLRAVARNGALVAHAQRGELPADLTILATLSRLPENLLAKAIEDGTVRKGMSRKEASSVVRMLLMMPPKSKSKGESAAQLRHQLDDTAKRLADLEGEFEARVQETAARLAEESRPGKPEAASAAPDQGEPLATRKADELRTIIREMGLSGYSAGRKADLVQTIEHHVRTVLDVVEKYGIAA